MNIFQQFVVLPPVEFFLQFAETYVKAGQFWIRFSPWRRRRVGSLRMCTLLELTRFFTCIFLLKSNATCLELVSRHGTAEEGTLRAY